MTKVTFSRTGSDGSAALRETHARLVAVRLRDAGIEPDANTDISAEALAKACSAVRDGYRCRDVRKELRRVMVLCDEAGQDGHIAVSPWPRDMPLAAAA